ncbi:MAG: BamA/TamA family outer membrane protein, partial [Bacteroidia bacterium]|nr:BamA/TamA family outer membrane protein [Bacteroidia bacterium]
TFDSIIKKDSVTTIAFLNCGNKYKAANISFHKLSKTVLNKTGLKPEYFTTTDFNYEKIVLAQEKILKYYENHGYPFARVRLDSIRIYDNLIYADCVAEPFSIFRLDSLDITGKSKISLYYLYKYLNLNLGELYCEQKLSGIDNKLKELPFIKETKPYEILFEPEKFKLYLYLENKKANQFYGILGVMPNKENTGKLLLTGELKLLLLNSFNRGEEISVKWERLETQTQKLDVGADYPFIFHSPLGIDINFNMYWKDTTYFTINTITGIKYILQGTNYVKAFADYKNSSLISTAGFENLTVIPQYADVSSLLYGFGYYFEKLDYKYNPKTGIIFQSAVREKKKKVRKNSEIPENLYNNIDMVSTQTSATLSLSTFIPLFRKMTVMLKSYSAHISNSNLFENELFKIGGFNTLRGFDEETISASSFSILTLEYRYLFEQNSNVSIFFNGSWYEKKLPSHYISDIPYGFGIGLNLFTKAGIFSIGYALGKQFDNPVEIRAAKIYFGYLNRF